MNLEIGPLLIFTIIEGAKLRELALLDKQIGLLVDIIQVQFKPK